MLRLLSAVVVAVTLASAIPAQAQWFSSSKCANGDCWDRYWATWRSNNIWPQQWVGYDRMSVCAPLSLQAEKGWHRMNLVGSYHFSAGTNKLNEAGEHKIRFILTKQPPERRIIFVERGMTQNMTAARVDAVQQSAVAMLPGGALPEVAASNMILEGWPAEDVDATLRSFDKTRPDPRLPSSSSEASSTGDIGGP